MLATDLLPQIQAYLREISIQHSLEPPLTSDWQLTFLAQGEYNINYLLTATDRSRRVVRVNVGTQIGKPGGAQIAYEAAALALLGPYDVAPSLFFVDDTLAVLPYGVLIMKFLPGGPLRYDDARHITAAARTLARLHQVPVPANSPFIRRRVLYDDLAEAQGWLLPYLNCNRVSQEQRRLFAALLDHAEANAQQYAGYFPLPVNLVHTDVQAHNFIVHDPKEDDGELHCHLVDWERPLVDDPTYDLAHFLIPTTTRWKCGYLFSNDEQEHFLTEYCASRPDLDPSELRDRLHIRRPFILLRAISWCASAWVEYTEAERMIANHDTLKRIEEYLQPDYLAQLFPEWLKSG